MGNIQFGEYKMLEGEKWVRAHVMLADAPDIQVMTNVHAEVDRFAGYLQWKHSELTITRQNYSDGTLVLIATATKSASKTDPCPLALPPLTFNTSAEHQLTLPHMLYDKMGGKNLPSCFFSISIHYDPGYTHSAIILGEPLLRAYNLTIDYANQTIALTQWRNNTVVQDTDLVDDLEEEGQMISIVLFIVLLVIILGLIGIAVYVQRRRKLQKELAEKLNQTESEVL